MTSPVLNFQPATMAELLQFLLADTTLPARRRTALASGVRRLSRVLGKPLERISVDAAALRTALTNVAPAAVGLSPGSWTSLLSTVRGALRHAGIISLPARSTEPMTPAWAALFACLGDRQTRCGLSRFVRYCSALQIAPTDVDDAVLAGFHQVLRTDAISGHPLRMHRAVCSLWNLAATKYPDWPQQRLMVPNNRRDRALPWTSFPATLHAEVEAYLSSRSTVDCGADDEDEGGGPLRASSIKCYRHELHGFVSALVARGHDPQALTSLRDVVAVATVRQGLRFYRERADGAKVKRAMTVACILLGIARHWVKVDDEHLKALRAICRANRPKERGMTAKNRRLLRQFDDPANVARWVTLPQRMFDEAARVKVPTRTVALEVQAAVAIEILQMLPLRISNLALLDLEQHLVRSRGGQMHVIIPAGDVKNDVAIEAQLPPETVRLIDLYLKRYHPLLTRTASTALFPGRDHAHKCVNGLRIQIVTCVRRRCGLQIHPHLCRHIAAKLYLDSNPGGYGVIQLLHGHKSIDTTTAFYCGAETSAAIRHYDQQILNLRGSASPFLLKKKRRR